MTLKIKPCELRDANAYVALFHRHNKPVVGHKFSVKCLDNDRLCGVAIVGRPIARQLDDGDTLEILRVCTDGTKNACSKLYGACCRVASALGYERIVTYTLETEPGTSLRASNWECDGIAGGGSWDTPSRPRELTQTTMLGIEVKYPTGKKIRWQKKLNEKERPKHDIS